MKDNFNIKIKLLNEFGKIPIKSHLNDIGYDLFSDSSFNLEPQQVTLVTLGIAIELPKNVGGFVLPRSGLSSKNLIAPINSPGLIDPGYRGELQVPLMNYSQLNYIIEKHDRVAQLVLIKTEDLIFEEVSELEDSERSSGGFGSTGKN